MMTKEHRKTTAQPTGPDALPPEDTVRWVPRRKAQVVTAVADGMLTADQACEKYGLTVEELTGWQRTFQHVGVKGLRTTKTQFYRGMLNQAD